jgi:hypothetical protein
MVCCFGKFNERSADVMLHTNKIPTTTILFDIGGGAYLPYRSAVRLLTPAI